MVDAVEGLTHAKQHNGSKLFLIYGLKDSIDCLYYGSFSRVPLLISTLLGCQALISC